MVKHDFLNHLDVILASLMILVISGYTLFRIIRRSMWYKLKRTTVQE